jgi:hypothetical protein
LWVLSEWRSGFLDWIVFGLFGKLRFLSMWGVIFLWGLTGLCLYMSFGLFWYGLFILMWGLTFVDFGYSLLWGVFILSRRRVDFSLRHRDDALFRDTDYPFTV